jgi:hypothetical protein
MFIVCQILYQDYTNEDTVSEHLFLFALDHGQRKQLLL